MLVISVSCCCQENPDLQPSKDLDQYVQRSISQWLDVRMDDPEWQIFSKADASWKQATSIEVIETWFTTNLGTTPSNLLVWDFSRLISDIKKTEIYLRGPPSTETFLEMVKSKLNSFHYNSFGASH